MRTAMKYTKHMLIALSIALVGSLQAAQRRSNPFVSHLSLCIGTSQKLKGTCYWDDLAIIEQK